MYQHKPIGRAFVFSTDLCILAMGFIPATVTGEDETEILKIAVDEPTKPHLMNISPTLQVRDNGVVALGGANDTEEPIQPVFQQYMSNAYEILFYRHFDGTLVMIGSGGPELAGTLVRTFESCLSYAKNRVCPCGTSKRPLRT